jgi:hypothetical protein
MPRARNLAAATCDLVKLFAKFRDQAAHHVGVAGELGGFGIDRGVKRHGPRFFDWLAVEMLPSSRL